MQFSYSRLLSHKWEHWNERTGSQQRIKCFHKFSFVELRSVNDAAGQQEISLSPSRASSAAVTLATNTKHESNFRKSALSVLDQTILQSPVTDLWWNTIKKKSSFPLRAACFEQTGQANSPFIEPNQHSREESRGPRQQLTQTCVFASAFVWIFLSVVSQLSLEGRRRRRKVEHFLSLLSQTLPQRKRQET